MSSIPDLERLPTTGEVARSHGLAEGQLQALIRHRAELQPPLVRGRRRWRPEDVERLRAVLAARSRAS